MGSIDATSSYARCERFTVLIIASASIVVSENISSGQGARLKACIISSYKSGCTTGKLEAYRFSTTLQVRDQIRAVFGAANTGKGHGVTGSKT